MFTPAAKGGKLSKSMKKRPGTSLASLFIQKSISQSDIMNEIKFETDSEQSDYRNIEVEGARGLN